MTYHEPTGHEVTKRKKRKIDYRKIKTALNSFYSFDFKMPRKGADFTPQQKRLLTNRYKKVKRLANDKKGVSFIPYPKGSKLPNVDGVRTNKGLFYKFPDAKAEYNKFDKKYHIVVRPRTRGKKVLAVKRRRDIFFPFPPSVINDPQRIIQFVNALRAKFPTAYFRWSTENKRAGAEYDEKLFQFYFSIFVLDDDELEVEDTGEGVDENDLTEDDIRTIEHDTQQKIWRKRKYQEKLGEGDGFYNGVFVVLITE